MITALRILVFWKASFKEDIGPAVRRRSHQGRSAFFGGSIIQDQDSSSETDGEVARLPLAAKPDLS